MKSSEVSQTTNALLHVLGGTVNLGTIEPIVVVTNFPTPRAFYPNWCHKKAVRALQKRALASLVSCN